MFTRSFVPPIFQFAALFLISITLSFGATASDKESWDLWKQDGVHALMRHAIAPGTGDPSNFTLGDCSTQRNLDGTGRKQASDTGNRIRQMGIPIDHLLSSQWCRCVETAELLELGKLIEEPALNSFFRDRSTENAQTRAITERLLDIPDTEKALLVTHQVNITALTGIYPRSGEIILIKADENGEMRSVGRLMP
jgi:phosphohistidine phosphatase SixA